MGKFNPKAFSKKEKEMKSDQVERIKEALRNKDLIEIIKDGDTPVDGTLLFGAHKGKKISELVVGYDTAAYVTGYLVSDKMLPKKFRKQVQEILDNYDPFGTENPIDVLDNPSGMNIREVFEDEDVPWDW